MMEGALEVSRQYRTTSKTDPRDYQLRNGNPYSPPYVPIPTLVKKMERKSLCNILATEKLSQQPRWSQEILT